MQIKIESKASADVGVILADEKGKIQTFSSFEKENAKTLADCKGILAQNLNKKPDFKGFSSYEYYPSSGKYKKIILAVLGKEKKVGEDQKKSSLLWGARLGRMLLGVKSPKVDLIFPDAKDFQSHAADFFEGLGLATYDHALYKKKESPHLEAIAILSDQKNLATPLENALHVRDAVKLARDSGNLAPNDFFPSSFQKQASLLSKKFGFTFHALDKKAMQKLNFGCLLAVAQGSDQEPYLTIMEYKGAGKEKPFMIVGKGITFDTGGYSIKPANSMEEMKFDMCGGAAILGAMHLIGAMKPKMNVVALIPTCENLINGHATRPGDVIQAYNGKTIEVINTDAEGRLILADALAYGEKTYHPQAIIDLATLTGACVVALGKVHSGMFTNHPELAKKVEKTASEILETVWPMPLDADFQEELKGTYSDLKNTGNSRWGGACTAAKFLENFVGEVPWVHLDIAGTAWDADQNPLYPAKGATGVGVRLLYNFLKDFSSSKAKAKET